MSQEEMLLIAAMETANALFLEKNFKEQELTPAEKFDEEWKEYCEEED